MSNCELLLKCNSGIFVGKFFYLNANVRVRQEPEVIGSGSFEDLGVTASLQDCNLEPVHTKIQFTSEFFISDLSTSKGTYMKIPHNSYFRLTPTSQLRFHKSVFSVSSYSKSPASLVLTSGRSVITVHDRCRVASKKPADFVLASFEDFSAVFIFENEEFSIIVESGSVFYKLSEEKILFPGDEVSIGNLEFEACRYNYGKFSSIGHRATMEDSDQIIQDLRILHDPVAYYSIFDGHGGSQCSIYLKENLHKFLIKHLKDCMNLADWRERIIAAYEECDSEFLALNPQLAKHVGSAALVCLLYKNSLVSVNCGDCRALLSRGSQAIQLTTDHKPDLPSERSRIEKLGGFVNNGRVQNKLALSRAFGDFEYKSSKKIVTSTPDVEIMQIDPRVDEFLILGCDGLFEAFSNPDLVKYARNRLKRMKVTEQDPNRVVKDLVTEAVHMRRTQDNVSAILVTFCAGIQ